MLRRYALLFVAALTAPGHAAPAASAFDGRWVADLSTQGGLPEDDYLVINGIYTCRSCSPARAYPADGKPHPVPGDADVTSEAVTITGPRTIETRIVGATMTRTTTMTVSADGRSAIYVSIDHRSGMKEPLRTVYEARRVTDAPPGAHPVSGKWQGVRYVSVPVQIRTIELHDTGDRLSYSTPIGVAYTATFGGGFAPIHGHSDTKMLAAVERLGERQIKETRKEDGKVISIRTYTISLDGRSLEMATSSPGSATTFRVTAHRR